jgi:hypothetical protein
MHGAARQLLYFLISYVYIRGLPQAHARVRERERKRERERERETEREREVERAL